MARRVRSPAVPQNHKHRRALVYECKCVWFKVSLQLTKDVLSELP